MANELIINARPQETRVAILENGQVVELHFERRTGQELMGNIYKGRVVRVLPGMQAAFVDIGLERSAFLYVSDIQKECSDLELMMLRNHVSEEAAEEPAPLEVPRPRNSLFSVEDLLHEGQELVVQISKEPLGTKGARLTSYVSLPGRHLVLLPTVNHIGVSRKIEDPVERERLKNMLLELRPDHSGFIIRTVSEGVERGKIKTEMDFLLKLWTSIQERTAKATGPALLYRELSISLRSVRDLFAKEVDRLVIDSVEVYNQVMEFIDKFVPALRYSVELYDGAEPVFDHYGIEMEISRALHRKIWLRSGGYIVIELTEALTAIDVNTGSYVGTRNLEDTILKTNMEAVKEIALQLRLRNLGGLIVIDFIDMEKKANREKVSTALNEALSKDRAKTHILKMSDLGLIEMTRKRTRENLNRTLGEACFYCEGRGILKSRKTICCEIFRDVEREAAFSPEEGSLYVLVNPVIDHMLREEEQQSIVELEKRVKKRITILTRDHFHLEQFEITEKAPG